jgi:HPt (histidine-containing phosphotransfer) domain-containing protein
MADSIIDITTFEDLKATAGADFVRELVDTFLAEAPIMMADLRSALAAGDAERFRRTAHSLKSNSNTFGALQLGTMAKAIELGGLASVEEAGGKPIDELEVEFTRVAKALTELKHA